MPLSAKKFPFSISGCCPHIETTYMYASLGTSVKIQNSSLSFSTDNPKVKKDSLYNHHSYLPNLSISSFFVKLHDPNFSGRHRNRFNLVGHRLWIFDMLKERDATNMDSTSKQWPPTKHNGHFGKTLTEKKRLYLLWTNKGGVMGDCSGFL